MSPFGAWDLETFRILYGSFRSVPADLFFALLSTSAVGGYHVLPALALSAHRQYRREGFRYLLAVILSALGPLFKTYIGHDRPSTMAWVREQETFYTGSFPSGHTTLAFSVGVTWFLTLGAYPKTRRWRWLFLLWAPLCGLSRIYRGVHWPSDVIGGACLGTLVAALIFLAFPPLTPREEAAKPPDGSATDPRPRV